MAIARSSPAPDLRRLVGRQVDGDAAVRPDEPAADQGRANPVTRLAAGRVGQADHVVSGKSGADEHLDGDGTAAHAEHGRRRDGREHRGLLRTVAAVRRAIQRWRTATGPTTVARRLAEGCHGATASRLPRPGGGHLRDSPPVRPALSIVAVAALVAALAACDDDGARRRRGILRRRGRRTSRSCAPCPRPTTRSTTSSTSGRTSATPPRWRSRRSGTGTPTTSSMAWTSDDQQEVLASTFAAERSAVAIADWLEQNCGIDFGPVTTIVPATITTTTVPGATTVAGAATTTTTG